MLEGRLARRLNARGMLVDCRVAPEHAFPAGLDDCCAAYEWLLAEGTAPKSIITGDSAGGGLALSTVVRMRDCGVETPAAIVLISPVTDLTYSGQSRRDNDWIDPTLPNDDGNFMGELYLGGVPHDHPLASPLFADLSRLPPTLLQVGSTEVLLDDSLRVAAKIRTQGGECECEVWHDMLHDWPLFAMLRESRRALRRIVQFVDRVTRKLPAIAA
ncbi:alpha/beta hydrolase [Sphingomonas tabacisoli]|uniref:Alpha/beta hydrolase n=1 Tax=Sphingomonas tabacisoli TaxID=2249466 RepID=A0ABW4I0M1_9SPHN